MDRLRTLEVNPNIGLNEMVEKYFDSNIDSSCSSRIGDGGIHYFDSDVSRGFFFSMGGESKESYITRMESLREVFLCSCKLILREFIDHENEIAGFSWRNR